MILVSLKKSQQMIYLGSVCTKSVDFEKQCFNLLIIKVFVFYNINVE